MADKSPLKALKEAGPAPHPRRLPLLSVEFSVPVPIPGSDLRARMLVSGCAVPGSATGAKVPQLFLDPELHVVAVGECLIPVHLVLSMIRAKAAKG